MADIYDLELPAEIIGIEVNRDQTDLTLKRWSGECSMRLALPTAAKPAVLREATKTRLQTEKVDFNLIPLAPSDERDFGGLELEVVLKERPSTNQIVLGLDLKNLNVHYQPPLTAEEISRGDIRPDNVVGSYAVYHSTKTGLMRRGKAEGEKYRAGQAFHIYRPQAFDQRGRRVWCDLGIGAGLMTIAVPQDWLDAAVYPVVIDPDFGHHGTGGTGISIENAVRGAQHTCPVGGVVGVSIVACMRADTSLKRKLGLYNAGNDFITNSETQEKTDTFGYSWQTHNFLTPPELSNQAYRLTAWGESGSGVLSIRYNVVGGVTHYYRGRTYQTGTGWPNPLSPGFQTTANLQPQIYCVYEALPAAAGGGVPAPLLVAQGQI